MEQHKDLEIPLKEIASNTFHKDNYLGGGGFGEVYKGEVSRFKERGMVAFKVLDRKYGQGETEFFKEIEMLSKYKHDNIITLLGYCMEGKELILVYEYASHGSLDSCLDSAHLTWTLRLKICLQAAKGLRYLHDPNESHLRVTHRDIKSANILLDDKWNAKVSDFGLSKISLENANNVTYATGTSGYLDPQYYKTYMLTEKSDVYSFGVTLFEVLCGRLCYDVTGNNELLVFVHKWMKSYEQHKLEEIVFEELDIKQIDANSLKVFSDVAYKCLNESREDRPSMAEVVTELEVALQAQEDYDVILSIPMSKAYQEVVRVAVTPLSFSCMEELQELLSKGILINGGKFKVWFSINDEEQHCIMLSIEDCLIRDDSGKGYSGKYSLEKDSRFVAGCYFTFRMEFKIRVITPLFLSPHVTYGVNLVFKYSGIERMKQQSFRIMYKLLGETKVSLVNVADMRGDGWLVAKLYQFTNEGDKSNIDVEIIFEGCSLSQYFYIEGIEFQPLGRVDCPVVAIEYEEILKAAETPLFYRSTEELKLLLTKGILLKGGKRLFCLNEKGQHIERIYIQALNPNRASWVKYDDCVNSRFPGGACYAYESEFNERVRSHFLTPGISYTVNLVFRYLFESDVNAYTPLRYKIVGENEKRVLVIYETHKREDGCLIAPLYRFTSQHKTVDLQFEFERTRSTLLVAGIEFQPSEDKVELQEYQDILEVASQPLFYTSLDELKHILSKGIYLYGYKTYFSLNKKGEHCHIISMKDCLNPVEDFPSRYVSGGYLRFPEGLYKTNKNGFKTHVQAQFLSPSITYTVNLILDSYRSREQAYVDLKYRLRGETTTFTVYLANWGRYDDTRYVAELYQFTSDGSIVDLEIYFENTGTNIDGVEGILFQPLEIVEDPLLKDDKAEDIQAISDSGIHKLSNSTAKYAIKKILYSTPRKWFQSNKDTAKEWSYLDENGKKCVMLSARLACYTMKGHSTWRFLPESRFGEALVITAGDKFELVNEIKPDVLSAHSRYATYFVYKLSLDQSKFELPLEVCYKYGEFYHNHMYNYLVSPPNTPIIGQKFAENSYNPLNRHNLSSLPQQRSDGWMEVKTWEFETFSTPETVSMHLKLEHPVKKDLKLKKPVKKDLSGLIIYGIEIRPV